MSQHPAKCSSHWGGECDCDFPLLEATDHLRAAADMLMKTCPRCEELESEVAQLRADGQRLRDALDTIYKIAAGGDVRRTAFEALHPDEAPLGDAP